MKKAFVVALAAAAALVLGACGNQGQAETGKTEGVEKQTETTSANEEYFTWDGTIIEGLTALGAKQEELVIPAKCTGFKGCILDEDNSVKKVSFEDGDDIILNNAFMAAKDLTALELPEHLSAIGDMEFSGCEHLQSIHIPNGVQTIGWSAFDSCKALVSVDASDGSLREIADDAFMLCGALQEVKLPDTVEKIGASALKKTGLATVTLPTGIKEIGELAFAGCPNLTDVYIPEGVEFESVDSSAFTQLNRQPVAHVVEGSWADLNFDKWCGTMTEKVYDTVSPTTDPPVQNQASTTTATDTVDLICENIGCTKQQAESITSRLSKLDLPAITSIEKGSGDDNSITVTTEDGKKYEVGIDKLYRVYSVRDMKTDKYLFTITE